MFKIFDPTASATVKSEKCGYGPTLQSTGVMMEGEIRHKKLHGPCLGIEDLRKPSQIFSDYLHIVTHLLIMDFLKSFLVSLIYSENTITEVILHIDTGS